MISSDSLKTVIRAYAAHSGVKYAQARTIVLTAKEYAGRNPMPLAEAIDDVEAINEIVASYNGELSFAEAEAEYLDPANERMCDDCGWTHAMVCPECAKGCGCETRCTGWRHAEYARGLSEPDEHECDCGHYGEEYHCCECGASGVDLEYNGCACEPVPA